MSVNLPLISVIIPAYNSRHFIVETIESVLQQSYFNLEVIVVDDGSSDGQDQVIIPFCNSDARMRYIYQPNAGVSTARNIGFNHSAGRYIAFLDADDVWLPDNLSLKIEKFALGNYGLVHSDAFLIDENSNKKDGIMAGREGRLLNEMLQWKTTQIPGPSSVLIKREVLNAIGLFDPSLSTSADQDLFLRISALFEIGRVPMPTWKYRLHSANMHKRISTMEKDVLRVYRKASVNKLFKNIWFEKKSFANMYLILAASWAVDGENKTKALYYAYFALLSNPASIINIFRRLVKL